MPQIPTLVDRCGFLATAGGLTDFTVSAAAAGGFMTPVQAGVVDGRPYSYFAQSASGSEWEVARGTTSGTATLLARTTILFSSNANAKVNFSAAPNVYLDLLSEDVAIQLAPLLQKLYGGV